MMGEQCPQHPETPLGTGWPAERAGGDVSAKDSTPAAAQHPPQANRRRLRILCLHGFRQSARSFEGRTHALRRRLKDVAELVFVDAPHELPALDRRQDGAHAPHWPGFSAAPAAPAAPALASATRHQQRTEALQERPPAARRAWLLVPGQYAALRQPAGGREASSGNSGSSSTASFPIDPGQFEQQTAGWQESEAAIQQALQQMGPFDGVLGLSQGAAVAAVLVAQQWQAQVQQQEQAPTQLAQQLQQSENGCCTDSGGGARCAAPLLRFAVLCSGYRSRVHEHAQLLCEAAAAGGVTVPSLHVFGGGGADRQISTEESAALAGCFHLQQRAEVRHGAGHIIPSSGDVLSALRDFLMAQQRRLAHEQQRPAAGQQ